MKKKLIAICVLITFHLPLFAQNVGINTTTPDASAALDITATDKGMLVPRLTTIQRVGITTPATGLLVFDTTLGFFYYYTGSAWTPLLNTETDPKITSINTNYIPKWNGTSLSDGKIYDNGLNIGIGTTSPTEKLEVLGKTKTTNFQMTNGATNGYVLKSDIFGNGSWVNSATIESDPQVASTTANYVPKWNGTALQDGILYDNGTKIGVGTTTIANESRLALGAVDDYEGGQLQFNSGINNTVAYHLDTYNDAFRIMSGTNTGTTDLRMYLSSAGDLGIGTSAPTGKLDINGKTVTTNLQMTNGATDGYVLQSDDMGNAAWVNPTIFNTSNWTTSGTNQYNALSGNVGIGTVSPTEKLDVQGNINIKSGRLTFGSSGKSVFIGQSAGLNDDLTDNENTFVGYEAGTTNTTGSLNQFFGKYSGRNNLTGNYNTAIGGLALYTNTAGNNNTTVGTFAGYNALGSGNVMLGFNAGFSETGSNKLYIDNSSTSSPLIYGEFNNNLLRVNGTLNINNAYSLPTVAGTANYLLQTNGAGTTSWVNPSTITGANWTTNGLNQYSSLSGNVGIGTTTPTSKLHVVGSSTLEGQVNFNSNWNIQTGSDYYLEKNGSRYMTVYGTGGNVGIGTSTPNYKLDVQSSSNAVINAQSSGSTASFSATAPNSNEATLNFNTYSSASSTPSRWKIGKENTSETGSDAGSNFVINRYDDAGAYNGQPLAIDRQSGTVTIGNDGASSSNNTLKVNGSMSVKISVITTSNNSTTLTGNDYMLIYRGSTSGNSITLPSVSSCPGRIYTIVNHSSTAITTAAYFTANGTGTSGVTAGTTLQLVSDGTFWHKMN